MIQLAKFHRINDKPTSNTLSSFENNVQVVDNQKIPSYQLSSYHFHFDVSDIKIIFENYLFNKVKYRRYYAKTIILFETHLDDNYWL